MRIAGWEHIVPLFRWQRRLLAGFFAAAIGRSFSSIVVLILIQKFLQGAIARSADRGRFVNFISQFTGEGRPLLWTIAGIVASIQIGGSLLGYWSAVLQQRVSKIVELGMMEKLIRHLLTLDIPFFDRQSHGDIMQAVRTDVMQLRVMVKALSTIALEAVLAGGIVLAAALLSPTLALVSLVIVPLASVPVYIIAKKTFASSIRIRKTGYLLADIVLQILRGIRVIKVFQAEDVQVRASVDKGKIFYDNVLAQVRVQRLGQVVMESLSGILTLVVILYGGSMILAGKLNWAGLLTFLLAVRALYGPLNNINNSFIDLQTTGGSVQRIAELLKAEPGICDAPDARPLPDAPRTIGLDHVTFGYGDEPVLRDVSFLAQAGETIGVVGPSGSGKTTLLGLLVRFYDPTVGAVVFDGRPLRGYKLADVYSKVALVTQEPFLFATTARENIRCARPAATDAEVERAARAAYIHEEILSLPQGYETPIGMGGRELSGGQRQRVSVARALLKNAPILLLDEATSSLDSVAEAEVQRAIDALMVGRTSFVVAHRLSTLRNANRTLVFDKGRLVGFAGHEELLATCGVYQRLWEAQRLASDAGEAGPASSSFRRVVAGAGVS